MLFIVLFILHVTSLLFIMFEYLLRTFPDYLPLPWHVTAKFSNKVKNNVTNSDWPRPDI